MRFLAFLLLSACLASAGDRKFPPIVELARTAPPELFADTVLRVIQGGRIAQSDAQIELLEQAFAVVGSATEPVRLIAIPGTPPDTREIYRGKAGELALDRLTLRSRIVREMVTVNRAKARALFDEIERPKLDPRPCTDPLVADAGPYYEAAAAIAQSGFTEREKQSEAHVQFLAALLAGAQSPYEIAAWTRAVQSVALSAPQWTLLIAALEAKLAAAPPDYRSFAMSLDALQAEVRNLMDVARANGAGDSELVQSFRKYVAGQLQAARCSPDIALGLDQIAWLRPGLEEAEMKPAKRGDRFNAAPYFQSGDSKQIGESLTQLRAAAGNRREMFADFLRDFGGWRPDGPAIDVFHQKATVLRALVEMTPRGEDRDRLLGLVPVFLEAPGAEAESPAEWLWEARALVQSANSDAPKLAEALRRSANAALAVYAQLGYFGDSSGTSK
jgi:hypothetical protein